MTDYVVNWKEEISVIAGPFLSTDTKDSWLGRALATVHRLNPNVSFRHFKDLFYGRIDDPKYSVATSVLSAAEQARIQEARCDALKIADIYRRTAQGLATTDPDFHREQIDVLLGAARIIGERDST